MTITTEHHGRTGETISVDLSAKFCAGWNRLDGVTVRGNRVTIDPATYFYRYEDPVWVLCDWDGVQAGLLDAAETQGAAVEQLALEYVRAHGQRTRDAAAVLATAWQVYSYLFRDEHLADPGLAGVTPRMLRMLRECGTIMSLNRVELTGHISVAGPAWMFPATSCVVFDLDEAAAGLLDELYHGTFFNEPRRIESVKAHAALGGRLVHGCQSVPNQSGGCVVPYGTDIAAFTAELAKFKNEWIGQILARRGY